MSAVREAIEAVFRREHGLLMAALVRSSGGDFEKAEDALHEAFAQALEKWPGEGIPEKPAAWLLTAARHRAVDRARRDRVLDKKLAHVAESSRQESEAVDETIDEIEDDRLRLIFTCCHPAIDETSRVALTLRTLGGLTTDEVARAFLVPEPTMAQRLVRVKQKIKDAGIPYRVPPRELLAERTSGVLAVIYLIFNEGYTATGGETLTRTDLASEAIRLGEVVAELMPDEAEALGLLSLMLLHDARREARVDDSGEIVLLEEQDRSLWDREQIARGADTLERAMSVGERPARAYVIQAAIAALHCTAPRASDTDWEQIARLYGGLTSLSDSPVVALNEAVAIAMARGPVAGLARLDELAADDRLTSYHLYHAARADLLRRDGRREESAAAYKAALELTGNAAERRFLERRLQELSGGEA